MGQFNVHGRFDLLLVHREFCELLDVSHVRHDRILAQPPLEGEVVMVALHG